MKLLVYVLLYNLISLYLCCVSLFCWGQTSVMYNKSVFVSENEFVPDYRNQFLVPVTSVLKTMNP